MDERDPLGLVGETVRSWHVTDLVHAGGLSLVYRAVNPSDGRRAAIKCYTCMAELPEAMREVMRKSFIRVGRSVARLAAEHPGLTRSIGGGWLPLDNGIEIPVIVLEWLRGQTLEAIFDRARLPYPRPAGEVLDLMSEPIAALAAAHQAGLTHRDIKPSNLFVEGDLREGVSVKILDLNLAKLGVQREESMPRPSMIFMTPHYAAPEQFRGDDSFIGPWTDVYGLALVLVELMAGHGPVLAGDTIDALRRSSEDREQRPTPRALGLVADNTVEAVFKRALAVDIRDRFRNAGAFHEALKAAVKAEGRVTSSRISRVFGVLEDLSTEADELPEPPPPPSRPATSTVVAPAPTAPPAPPGVTGDTVIARAPAQAVTGYTVLAPLPPEQE